MAQIWPLHACDEEEVTACMHQGNMVLGMQGASLGDQEAAHTGDFIKEGSTESQQLALSHAPMSSPSEPVLAGKSPAAMHLLHSCTHVLMRLGHLCSV